MTRREAPISPPVVLSIAGSDSGGGAGIQADLKTIEGCGGFGTSAITSVTAQNTLGVQGSHLLPIDDIAAQIESVTADFDVAAAKTGMLATSDVIELVTEHAVDLPTLVVDPVMVAASGDRLLAEDAEDAYGTLIAEATLVTPNTDEAEVLTGVTVDDPAAAERAGRIIVAELGADAALVKGGHLDDDHVVDTLVRSATAEADQNGDTASTASETLAVTTFRHDRVETDATHGSGCTLSSAIATRLAHGDDLATAVGGAIDLLSRAVRYNADVGQGPGSVHHLVELRNDASRQATVELVRTVATGVRSTGVAALAPPSGIGIVGATPHAETPDDVAAVPGRLPVSSGPGGPAATTGDRPPGTTDDRSAATTDDRPPVTADDSSVIPVAFGADDPLASVLLAVRENAPGRRFAALSTTGPARPDAFEGDAATVEGLATHLDGDRPIPADVAADLSALSASADAVTVPPVDDGPHRTLVLAETPAALLDRLRTLAAADG